MPNPPSKDDPPSDADPLLNEIIRQAIRAKLTPLAMILTIMHQHYDAGEFGAAAALARVAAPYLHPRLPASTPASNLATMPDADLDALNPHD